MPLEAYERNGIWWARGRVHLNGRPISAYIRRSTGASTEAGARDWIRATEDKTLRAHLLGEEKVITFADAVILYNPRPAEARYLLKIVPHLGEMPLTEIYPKLIRDLGPVIYPDAATDTWKRQIIGPVSAVINAAHQSNLCNPIRIKAYTAAERVAQDRARGKKSRPEKQAGSWDWLTAFRAKAGPHLGALAEFMFETGARISQAVALTPDDLDLQNGKVWIGASKGHDAQWISISAEMVATLANLPPKKVWSRQAGRYIETRVFGYADRGGPRKAWARACDAAGIRHLTPHEAGRHGFYTELTVRQGVSPTEAARAGRWSGPELPQRVYSHSEIMETEIRAKIRSGRVQPFPVEPKNSKKATS